MKNVFLLVLGFLISMTSPVFGQVQFSPQVGLNYTDIEVDINDILGADPETQSKAGVVIGADLRLGEAFYIQPGLFVIGSSVEYSINNDEYEITRYGAKLKGLLGYKIVDSAFRLRVHGGPTYDFQLGINDEDNPYFDKDDFKSGIFALDAGIGIDVVFLTADLGFSWAFSDAFDEDIFENEPRYESIYFTVGLVFGD